MSEETQALNSTGNLVENYGDYLFQFAISKLKNRDISLDMVQDTLHNTLEKIDQFEGRSSLRTWMTTILNRKIIDHWRKDKRSNGSKRTVRYCTVCCAP